MSEKKTLYRLKTKEGAWSPIEVSRGFLRYCDRGGQMSDEQERSTESEFEKWLRGSFLREVGEYQDEDDCWMGARLARDWILKKARENIEWADFPVTAEVGCKDHCEGVRWKKIEELLKWVKASSRSG